MNDRSPMPSIRGHLDTVTPAGVVEGWCCDQAAPERRPEVVVMIDGVVAGSALAAGFRQDLLAAAIGDGGYGFSFVIPWTMLLHRRTATVTVFEASTRKPIGEPRVLRNQISASLDDRLMELEGKIRLLESRLAEIGQQSQAAPDTGALFQTVGTFFTQLARDARDGTPLGSGAQLGAAIEAVEALYPTLTIPACETPLVTICIDGCAPLTALHACIAALLKAKAGGRADLILLDPGRFDDAVLLPVVVRNIRYIRTQLGPAQERNAIARLVHTPFVIFLSGLATVSPDWLDEILDSFTHDSRAGAVGGCVLRDDGLLERGGLVLGPDHQPIDLAAGRFADDIAQRVAQPVHALRSDAIAVRRAALLDCGGLDENCDTLSAAITDLSIRLGRREWSVQYQPYATVTWF